MKISHVLLNAYCRLLKPYLMALIRKNLRTVTASGLPILMQLLNTYFSYYIKLGKCINKILPFHDRDITDHILLPNQSHFVFSILHDVIIHHLHTTF